jgi:hypothetical protein
MKYQNGLILLPRYHSARIERNVHIKNVTMCYGSEPTAVKDILALWEIENTCAPESALNSIRKFHRRFYQVIFLSNNDTVWQSELLLISAY